MSMKKLWLAPLAFVWAAAYASPDTLYMEDGRRIRGDLVSVNGSMVVFNQDNGGRFGRAQRIRVNRADVMRIEFTSDNNTSDNGSYGNGSIYRDDSDVYTGGSGGWRGTGTGLGQDIVVRGDQPWTDTGIRVNAGDVFRIDASGYINWGPNRSDDPNGEVNSPYNANRPLPNRAGGSLIGRIGNGQPFYIGSGMQSFRAGTTGRLYLGVNDDYLQDNSGSFRVMITR